MKKNNYKVALVTGGTGGIGSSICKELAIRKINICFTYLTSKKKAIKLKKEILKLGVNVNFFKMDNRNVVSIKKALNFFFKKNLKINILINNSGISQIKNLLKINQNDWDNMINTNLRGPFFLTKFFLTKTHNYNWLRIINISSISGLNGGKFQIHYAITKAGLISLTKSLNNIYGKENFTINTIAPGLIDTKMIRTEINKKKQAKIKVGTVKKPVDVAKKILQIISEKSKHKSGRIFKI